VHVQASDAAGNITPWFTAPSFLVQASTVMDKSVPVFVSGSISTGPIIVGQTIPEIAARVTDDTGVSIVTFIVTDPRGGTSARVPGYRNNGTKTDGIWRNDWAVPATALTGLYTIYVEIIDEWQKRNTFAASTLFASGQNSGLLSIGHLLEVTSATPAVCSVTGVATWDRTGGIYTRATVNTLSLGTCTVLWRFLGSKGRAATSTTMNIAVNR
jgi:hypothetical protein